VVGGEAERVLQNVQGNLSRLTHRILMVQVEDLSEAMQRTGGWCAQSLGVTLSVSHKCRSLLS
jgi:hypothetical protein